MLSHMHDKCLDHIGLGLNPLAERQTYNEHSGCTTKFEIRKCFTEYAATYWKSDSNILLQSKK